MLILEDKMERKYNLFVEAETFGLGREYIGYNLELKKGKESLIKTEADNITDLGRLVIRTLTKYAEGLVEVQTTGPFYKSGGRMIEDIVQLYNNTYSKRVV